ncbi:Uncharacterized protein PHSC3_001796 [Chlamydiales bacterium STE3]|nr:Uncharacterized protein PHSC3_001796 [Chlamydiales bacterium STE3]
MNRSLLPERIPLSRLPSIWSKFFDEDLFSSSEDFPLQGVRIYEENNQLHVEAPVPGLNLNDIEVTLNKGVLWIKGESKQEEEDKKRKFYRSSTRNYSYSLVLPTQIDESQEPQAVYADGILKISLQLSKQGQTKKINVKSGKENG